MVAILIVNRKLINPGGKKNHKNGEILKPERFTEKKNKQNYE